MSIGDLLFYRSHGGLFDDAITLATGAPYTHVEIQVSATESIGALSQGIVRHAIPGGADIARTRERIDADRLADGLAWLDRQVGKPYGWSDIADDAEHLIDPHAPILYSPDRMDCSHLASVYLLVVGFPLPPEMIVALPLVSPNSLYQVVVTKCGAIQHS